MRRKSSFTSAAASASIQQVIRRDSKRGSVGQIMAAMGNASMRVSIGHGHTNMHNPHQHQQPEDETDEARAKAMEDFKRLAPPSGNPVQHEIAESQKTQEVEPHERRVRVTSGEVESWTVPTTNDDEAPSHPGGGRQEEVNFIEGVYRTVIKGLHDKTDAAIKTYEAMDEGFKDRASLKALHEMIEEAGKVRRSEATVYYYSAITRRSGVTITCHPSLFKKSL